MCFTYGMETTTITKRIATAREAARNGFASDHNTPLCWWCGRASRTLYVFDLHYRGEVYSGWAYCSDECHDEACTPD